MGKKVKKKKRSIEKKLKKRREKQERLKRAKAVEQEKPYLARLFASKITDYKKSDHFLYIIARLTRRGNVRGGYLVVDKKLGIAEAARLPEMPPEMFDQVLLEFGMRAQDMGENLYDEKPQKVLKILWGAYEFFKPYGLVDPEASKVLKMVGPKPDELETSIFEAPEGVEDIEAKRKELLEKIASVEKSRTASAQPVETRTAAQEPVEESEEKEKEESGIKKIFSFFKKKKK